MIDGYMGENYSSSSSHNPNYSQPLATSAVVPAAVADEIDDIASATNDNLRDECLKPFHIISNIFISNPLHVSWGSTTNTTRYY